MSASGTSASKRSALGIFHFDDRFAGRSEVAHIGQFTGHDSIEGRDDPGVAEHRFHLARGAFGDTGPRLHGVEISLRGDFLVEQLATAGQITCRLLTEGERLIELGLDLAWIELRDQIAGLYHLARGDQKRLDPRAYFCFNRSAKFCPHCADNFLARRTLLVFYHDGANRDRRERLGPGLLFRMTRDQRERGNECEERTQ